MHRLSAFFMAFMAIALSAYAQPAMVSGADAAFASGTLPLRNVQIEVRQVQQSQEQRTAVGGQGQLDIGPGGQSDLHVQAQAQQRQGKQNRTSVQTVLVLNGRSARIALGNSIPVRLVSSVLRNGVLLRTQSTVMLDVGTGFFATPRWDGSDRIALELAAQQSDLADARGLGARQTSSAATTLALALDEWTTVAQSDQSSEATASGTFGGSSRTEQASMEIQVRLTVR